MDQVGEFFSKGADRIGNWFITMSVWEYVVFAAFILLSVYFAIKVFRSNTEDMIEEKVKLDFIPEPDDD